VRSAAAIIHFAARYSMECVALQAVASLLFVKHHRFRRVPSEITDQPCFYRSVLSFSMVG
jgi:hypothetical protein